MSRGILWALIGLLAVPASGSTRDFVGDGAVALIDGSEIRSADLDSALFEAAGGLVLQEHVLDLRLRAALNVRSIALTDDLVAAERASLVAALADEARTDADGAERLLREFRDRRGLGEVRFASMLRRSAMLRLLMTPRAVSEQMVRAEFDLRFGPKVRIGLITAASRAEASDARRQIIERIAQYQSIKRVEVGGKDANAPTPGVATSSAVAIFAFSEVAGEISTKPGIDTAGLLEPVSPENPSYPPGVREELRALKPGEVSPVVSMGTGFGVVVMVERIEASADKFDDRAPLIRRQLGRAFDREAMDVVAQQLLSKPGVSVLDRSLGFGWETRGSEGDQRGGR